MEITGLHPIIITIIIIIIITIIIIIIIWGRSRSRGAGELGGLCATDNSRKEAQDTPSWTFWPDSLHMVELRGRLGERLGPGVPLSPTVLFDHPTPARLLQHVTGRDSDNRLPRTNKERIERMISLFAACHAGSQGQDHPEEYFEALLKATDATRQVPQGGRGLVQPERAF